MWADIPKLLNMALAVLFVPLAWVVAELIVALLP